MAETPNPVRTCVGCRKRVSVEDLLRVVVVAGDLVPDPRRRLPGRGASLHPSPECLRAAERRRAFPRALRTSAPVEVGPLRSFVLGVSSETAGERGGGGGDRAGMTAGATTAVPGSDGHQAGPHVESRTSSDESAVKSPR